jgi:DNA repair protein RecN (Recombination protein N)
MLRFLGVRHLAVIDRLELEFEPGLNVLTGETGAGKTILVEAIELLLGGRASADLVRTGETLATVQAIFEENGAPDAIVRREVSAQGRSRAFLDDALATTAALREFGSRRVDLHGQHEHQALLDPAEHVRLLDAFADHAEALANVAERYAVWRTATAALERTQLGEREKRARIEIASFQLQEIDRAAPAAGEDEALNAERTVLANADRLTRLCSEAYAALYEGEQAALTSLAGVWKRLTELSDLDARFAGYLAQREEVKPRLEDLAFFLREYVADVDASPARLQAVEDRLAALERLKKKHGPSLDDVLARRAAFREELAALEADSERTAVLEREAREAVGRFLESARALSTQRQRAARELAGALVAELAELAMTKSRVEVRVMPQDQEAAWTTSGIDHVEFFLSPNPGEEVRPLARIASGGELSRVMLALRTVAISDEAPRTLIFDEVDAGIGGAAADAVGTRLQALGRRHQVLCVTHLPQIAARGDVHFQIAKLVKSGRTMTQVVKLDDSGREQEIARMMAGARISSHVLASAREMLQARRVGPQARTSVSYEAGDPWTGETEEKPKGESESPMAANAKGRRSGR